MPSIIAALKSSAEVRAGLPLLPPLIGRARKSQANMTEPLTTTPARGKHYGINIFCWHFHNSLSLSDFQLPGKLNFAAINQC